MKEISGFASESAEVDGVNLHYWVGGDPAGRPLLLWHGFLGTGYGWRDVGPMLADLGFSVLIPDMRGYGDSDKPAGSAGYDGRALAEEFRALVAKIGFGSGRPLTLVSHDMGAPPALIYAADHPDEVEGLVYMEVPVMLAPILTKIIAFTPEAMAHGSMWWWVIPHAPSVPEILIVGHEREFLTWFYQRYPKAIAAIEPIIDEYLRTFSGREGVLGALGVYRTAFSTIEQTTPLTENKLKVPVVALGGEGANGDRIRQMVELVAEDVRGGVVPDCGHFIPEERPEEVVRHVQELVDSYPQA